MYVILESSTRSFHFAENFAFETADGSFFILEIILQILRKYCPISRREPFDVASCSDVGVKINSSISITGTQLKVHLTADK